jgi:hypothetical protein
MQLFIDATAFLAVAVLSFQVSLRIGRGLLSLMLHSMQRVALKSNRRS